MKVRNSVTFLVVRSFLVSAKSNSLRTKKRTSTRVIDTKLFARVRKVTGRHERAKRVLQVLEDVFGSINGTTSLDGLTDGLALFLSGTGLGGGAGALPNGTEAFVNNVTGDLTNELMEDLFGANVTDVFAGLSNGTADNVTDIFGDLLGGLGPFGAFNETETGFFGFANGTDLFGGMFNDSSGFFGLPNGTDIFGGLFNESSASFGLPNSTDIFGGLFNESSSSFGLPNVTDMFGGLFNESSASFGWPNGTDMLGGLFNESSGFFGWPNGTDMFGGLFNESSGFFGWPNGTDIFGGLFNASSGSFLLPNGTFIWEGIFNGTGNVTDVFAGFFNGTGDVTSEILESLFGENVTEIMSGLWNGTSGDGEDVFAGLPEGLADIFGNFSGTDMMVCPETCAAEVCDIFSSEDGPDIEVLGDACEAGTIKACAGMYASLCEVMCSGDANDKANSSFFTFNASEVGDICSMCNFLDCCDGNKAFQTCVALLPAEALPDGVDFAGETGSAFNESATSEVALDEDTAAVDTTDNEAADEDTITDGSTSLEGTADTTTDSSRESEDSSHAPMLSVYRCISAVFLAILLVEF